MKIILSITAVLLTMLVNAQGTFIGTVSSNGTLQGVSWFDVSFSDADGIPDSDDDIVLTIDNNSGAVNLSNIDDFACNSFEFDVLNSSNAFTFFAVLGREFSVEGDLSFDNSPVTTFRILSNSILNIGGSLINTTDVLFSFTGGTVNYSGDADQTILPASYGVLEFTGTGNKLISSSGVSTISATTFTPNTSTVNFNSASIGQVLPVIGDYYNVVISGQNKELGSNFVATNNFEINSFIQVETKSFDLTIGGDLVMNGDLINTSDELLMFNGASSSTISGSQTLNLNTIIINKSTSGTSVTFNSPVEIESNGELILTRGALNANNNLTLLSTSSTLSATIGEINTLDASLSGNITVERYVPSNSLTGKFWWHIGSPLSNVPVSQLQDDIAITGSFTGSNTIVSSTNGQSMRTYTENNTSSDMAEGWVDFPASTNTETMTVGKGYRVYVRDNVSSTVSDNKIDVTGTPVTGDFNFGVTYTESLPTATPASDGWNFVANPYPSPIDWDASSGWTKTNIETVAYVWDAKQKTYRVLNSSNGIIPSFQGFWVQANSSSPTLIVSEECKVESNQAFSRPTDRENQLEVSIMDNSSNNLYNTSVTYLTIDKNATIGKDAMDVNQLGRNSSIETWENSTLLDIATKSSDDYILRNNSIPVSSNVEEVPLSITFNEGEEFTFEFHKQNFTETAFIVLKDKYLGTEQLLDDNTFITFKVDNDLKSKASDRFSLLVSSRPLSVSNKIDVNTLKVFPNPVSDDYVDISGLVSSEEALIVLSDMNGVLLSEVPVSPNNGSINERVDVSSLEKGIYLLTIKTVTDIYTQKIIIE